MQQHIFLLRSRYNPSGMSRACGKNHLSKACFDAQIWYGMHWTLATTNDFHGQFKPWFIFDGDLLCEQHPETPALNGILHCRVFWLLGWQNHKIAWIGISEKEASWPKGQIKYSTIVNLPSFVFHFFCIVYLLCSILNYVYVHIFFSMYTQ